MYENYTVLKDFFLSLSHQTDKAFHVFIVDLSKNKKLIQKNGLPLTVIEDENKGYAYGINRGLTAAIQKGFHHFCVINDDTVFQTDFVKNTSQSLINHPHSIVGGKIYYAEGYEYHKKRYTKKERGNVIWYAGGAVDWNHALTPHIGVDEVDTGRYDSVRPVGFVTGCLMCFDRSVVETVGLWDESYFLYFEDADYCVWAKKKRIPLLYDPSLVIWHKNAQSTEGSGSAIHRQYQKNNRMKFALKYAPLRTKLHILKNFLFERS